MAASAATYLERHGIRTELHNWPTNGQGVGATLLEAAATLGANVLVAGAYGHSRFREIVLGGVTRHLLRHARLPLLLAH